MGCSPSKSSKEAVRRANERLGVQRGAFISFDARVRAEWAAGDKDKDGVLSLAEVRRLLHKLNVATPERELKKQFAAHDADKNGHLDFEEFQQLFRAVQSAPDLKEVFALASGQQDVMVAEELQRYLTSSSAGRSRPSLVECAKMIMRAEGAPAEQLAQLEERSDAEATADTERFLEAPLLTYDGFLRLMTDTEVNSIFEHSKFHTVYMDMTQPLSHYFISSSHNTYLSGNQLNSESSAAAITKALRSGVRVIELDAWDGPGGQPIVNHGHTMCKPVALAACLDAIKKDAFAVSEYAVIITIENHCSLPQQKTQAAMLKDVFGDTLFQWEGAERSANGGRDWTVGPAEWASPADLKGRIVIRDKPKKKPKATKGNSKRDNAASPDPLGAAAKAAEAVDTSDQAPSDSVGARALEHGMSVSVDDGDVDGEGDSEDDPAATLLGVDEQLLRAMYIKNVKLRFAADKTARRITYEEPAYRSSSSIVEGKMIKLAKPGYRLAALCEYAQRHLVRVYPAGSRVESSNYDPVPAWNAGCQVVALNYQTHAMPLWLNQGKFADNGGCGYVLKPRFMLPGAPQRWTGDPTDAPLSLRVTVMSGHYLPKPLGASERSEVIDPYVRVALHGLAADQREFSTQFVDNNGFNPRWDETFEFSVRQPELALLSLAVYDHDTVSKDDFIGQAVVPLTALVPGCKVVPLQFANGAAMDGYLFVRVAFEPGPP